MSAADRVAVLVRPPGILTAGEPRRQSRRRGPRSSEARIRRRVAYDVRVHASGAATVEKPDPSVGSSLPTVRIHETHVDLRVFDGSAREHLQQDLVDGPCEAGPSPFREFSIFHCNIRGFLSHRAELEGQLQMMPSLPHMVCLNETLLDESVERIELGGYTLVSRRDRDDGRSGGGIAVFVLDNFAGQVVLREHSVRHERSWHTIHSEIGPVLCCAWYRPPCPGEVESIKGCEEEYCRLADEHIGCIFVGDLNVHHSRWLRHSASVSVEGTTLLRFCQSKGFKQFVKQPTREDHLLDLVIADFDASSVDVLAKIADHHIVLAKFDVGVPESTVVRRFVFDYSKADWAEISRDLLGFDWTPMDLLDVDAAERFFHRSVFGILRRHIPERELLERKSVHPWVNERCLSAIRGKNASFGTDEFALKSAECSAVIFEEFIGHVKRSRDKLAREKRGSKSWWRLTNEIMQKKSKASSIPALKSGGVWLHDSLAKANVFAEHFSSKFVLPPVEVNEHTVDLVNRSFDRFVLVRSKGVAKSLEKLDVDSGTGPDLLAARVLKICARELSLPLAKLIRRIIANGFWPSAWTVHWLMPLHKRKSVADPPNYRAINLTAQISKVVERFLCPTFTPTLDDRAFGVAQFAYRKQHGARDAILYYVLSWIAALNDGCKVGVYCSDVAGAFDRVDSELLLRKLASFGLNVRLLRIIRSWLRERKGYVIVSGEKSRPMSLRDMVFQGTVWGPSLWNAFFGDCVCAIRGCLFDVVIYADDCNAFKRYPRAMSNALIENDMRVCQRQLHTWGRANRVTFDAGKEETMVVSTTEACGGPAKLLGIEFDCKLVMSIASHKCATKAAWKTRSLLRVRRFYSTNDLVMLYKSHVLSFIEYRTSGLHFASTSVLNQIDDVQSRFLRQIGVSDEIAFVHFNLAPLGVRRDIGILGVIHRAARCAGPPQLWKFFRRDSGTPSRGSRGRQRHSMHLVEWRSGRNLELMRRSALGMIRVYNLLPAGCVTNCDVSAFQTNLTQLIRDRLVGGDSRWKFVLSPRHALFQYHPLVS